MRKWLLALAMVALAGADPTKEAHRLCRLTFWVEPPVGYVSWAAESLSEHGRVGEPISVFRPNRQGTDSTFYISGEPGNHLAPIWGYLPTTTIVDWDDWGKLGSEATWPLDHPIKLRPAPGAQAAALRVVLWFKLHYLVSGGILGLLGIAAAVGLTVVLPRYKSFLEERERDRRFNQRLHSLRTDDDLFLGRQFGEWVTMKRLGAGGMAVVYKGVSTLTKREDEAVAIKVMNPDLAEDIEYRRRFNREIQISRTLDHPNVVRMIDHGEHNKILYLIMEYVEGETLRDSLPEKGFPLPQALKLALGIVQGLIHAHQKGIVHRDLKPDNIMVSNKGLVKVMDLGLAKRDESENVTRTGDTFGTPAYMAPEQITGGTLMPATDQYAFGVMLFEMVSGRRPFEVADSLTLVMKHLQEPPPRVREYKSQLPEELDAVIDRMLLKDPAKRFKNLVEVQIELNKIQRKYCPE